MAQDAAALERLLLRRKLERFAQSSSLALAPSIASILVLLATFAPDVSLVYIAPWAACAILIIGLRLVLSASLRAELSDGLVRAKRWKQVNAVLVAGSLAWAVSFAFAAHYGGGLQHAVLGLVGAAIFNAVLLVHRNFSSAALVHIGSVGAGLTAAAWIVAGPDSWAIIALIVVFGFTLYLAINAHDVAFRRACEDELMRRESEDTVRILLKEYEAQASDFLWTLDDEGTLREVSSRLAEVSGLDAAALAGRPFLDLFDPGDARDRLAQLLGDRAPFRDLMVSLSVAGEERWWSLSARPQSGARITGVGRDVTDARMIEQQVQHMAHFDQLTGLANRYCFDRDLRAALASASSPREVALFYLDLDDFKSINDTQGHGMGDSLLSQMGARLAGEVREGDLVARLGGDEFAVLMRTNAGDGMLMERAHRFLAAAREPFRIDGHTFRVSTSIGIARSQAGPTGDEICDAPELMRRADLALYAAKARGRDEFAMFDEAIDLAAKERRRLESELREAIETDQLLLHYQPIVDLESNAVCALEVLVRWQHPRRGLLGPDEFLPIAEDSGLILPLGYWVIRRSLAELGAWDGEFRIAINLSVTQMRDAQLVPTIRDVLGRTGIAPERLELEITENVLIRDGDAGLGTMRRLRDLGASMALDDFGTGYSSLSYLRSYPFDRIKIDRNFVIDITTSEEARAIVSTIALLADALGMYTIAEGVENAEQLELLGKLGCDEAQGFFIQKPLAGSEIDRDLFADKGPDGKEGGVLDYRRARKAALARKGKRRA